ncbi:FkbM family methyltransferase [Flavobacterium sp. W4I14]|nr:FkbM family methyltransferase [Flavobacterium sp. W4I14]
MIKALERTLGFLSSHPLAKRHPFKSLYRLLSWQLKSRIHQELVVMPFIHGTEFWVKKGLTGITGNIYTGLHEFYDMGFLLHFLTNEDTFFDVGANVGSYTILAAGVRKAKCIAFEPIFSTFEILKKNIKLNQLEQLVVIKNVGVGEIRKSLYFSNNSDTTNHVVEHIDQNVSLVDIVPLDQFYETFKPSLLKIDVEGFETEVIRGAAKILADKTLIAIIIELNGSGTRYGFDEKKIHDDLLNHDFNPFEYNPLTRTLKKIESYGSKNTIYIRDLDSVMSRLNSAKPIKIFGELI